MIASRLRALASFALNVGGQLVRMARREPGATLLPIWFPRAVSAAVTPPAASDGPRPRIAAVVHAHYLDVLPGMLERMQAIPEDFDLYITTTHGNLDVSDPPARAQRVRVIPVQNRGRDILPLVGLARAGLLEGYELVCKVHTKKSAWRQHGGRFAGDGGQWRNHLLDGVLGGRAQVGHILHAFDCDPGLQLVTAPGQLLGPRYWGATAPLVWWMGRRVGVPTGFARLRFASGSMYWARGDLVRALGDLQLTPGHFDSEAGQDDGTTAHAVERLLGYLADARGYQLTVDQLAGD